MKQQNIIITGGTDGMGKATAHQLARLGACLLLVSRNRAKGEAAAAEIVRASGSSTVTYLQADLSLLGDLRRASEQIHQRLDHVDGLVHCAGGVFPVKRTLTAEGVELSFAVQTLARYALTRELLDLLRASPNPRVVSLAGGGTTRASLDVDNLNGEKEYGPFKAVQTSGITNDLLTLEWIAQYPEIKFYNYGPGLVRTGMIRRWPLPLRLVMYSAGRLISRSPAQAAGDIVGLAAGDRPSGLYGVGLRRNEEAMARLASVSRADFQRYTEALVNRVLAPAPVRA